MKVYLIMHTGKPYCYKTEAWAEADKIGENGICVKAVKAFLKKKYAKEYLERTGHDHLEIKTFSFTP